MKNQRRGTDERALFVISVAAELAGVHPQTLRMYERKGLIRPQRTQGNTRRYSQADIEIVRLIQELTQERGMNLAGAEMVLQLQQQLEQAQERMERLAPRSDGASAATRGEPRADPQGAADRAGAVAECAASVPR